MSLWACDKCGALTSFNFGVCSQCGGQAHLYNPQLPIGQSVVMTAPESAWRPIETAPRSGIAILLWQPWESGRDCTVIGHYANGWVDRHCEEFQPEPTHWMPLPAPPDSAPIGGEKHG